MSKKEIAVSNTSTLIFLSKINIFLFAKEIFAEIRVPKEVINEIFEKEVPENNLIRNELASKFLKEVETRELKNIPLELGEKSAISYCLEKNISLFLSDDKLARTIAESLGLKVKGILGIILANLKAKKLSKEKCEKLINELIEKEYYISSDLYSEIIKTIRGS